MADQVGKIRGLILGTAVGDALGLPAEGLSPDTIRTLQWSNWRHRFVFGKGMVSDDTEHTFFVCQALLRCGSDADCFRRTLAWKLRWWLLGLPVGIGLGTLRAIIKLWCFVPPDRSGVFSAGNGPAMRSAIIGARFRDDPQRMNEFVRCSTELTHKDPRAFVGALAVSYAAALGLTGSETERPEINRFLDTLRRISSDRDDQWPGLIDQIDNGLAKGFSVAEFANSLNLHRGVTGYVYHTVPVSIYAWLRHYGDFKTTMTEVLNCGGDTDTVGAITGALAGVTVGEGGIPDDWINNIWQWPRSTSVLRKAADELARRDAETSRPVRCFWPGVMIRNPIMTIIVFGHVFLRLIPARVRCYMRV